MLKSFAFILFAAAVANAARGTELVPTTAGMTWKYRMTQELGDGVAITGAQADEGGRIQNDAIYRLDGTETVEDQAVYKFEMYRDGVVTNTDLMLIDDKGMRCVGRVDTNGERTDLKPPQTIVAEPIGEDTSWDFEGKAGDVAVHQHYSVVGMEDVTVPAGKFHCFHIYAEQNKPDTMTIDRWFCPGVGIIKDVTTTRNKDGDLIQRIGLELKEKPRVALAPALKPQKLLTAGVSSDPVGKFVTDLSTEGTKIYARWQGHGLKEKAKIRCVWIAEDVGDIAPPNYTIDEANAVATRSDARGVFTLSRPEDGWAPGTYRVEFYVDDQLIETVKLKISAPNRFE